MPAIEIRDLCKDFLVPEKKAGLWGVLTRKHKTFTALDHVSFSVEEGEILGYIGPNGSGKSTTIKILTGILTPTQGHVNVLGFTPWKQRYTYTHNIGVVFGQKSLLWWDIAPQECFRLYKEIYEMNEEPYRERLAYLTRLFAVESFMHIPTRKLSLGQRMRCELVAALLHKPKVLFLDEPTIGLDVVAKQRMREAIREINEKEKTTVLLTTHDMRDIEELATKILILNEGKIVYEGTVEGLHREFIHENTIQFEVLEVTDKKAFARLAGAHSISQHGHSFRMRFDSRREAAKEVLDRLFEACRIGRLEVHEPTLETVIREIYERPDSKTG
ncbi:MAG: ABC transporter ATP-binding protein [Candidatus Diapherotrites archaeon]|nr:ABC transporter ATP-binding protein [Candidatus Diapherotrites archaeon]